MGSVEVAAIIHELTPVPLSASQRGGVTHCILVNSPSLRSREGEKKGVSSCGKDSSPSNHLVFRNIFRININP